MKRTTPLEPVPPRDDVPDLAQCVKMGINPNDPAAPTYGDRRKGVRVRVVMDADETGDKAVGHLVPVKNRRRGKHSLCGVLVTGLRSSDWVHGRGAWPEMCARCKELGATAEIMPTGPQPKPDAPNEKQGDLFSTEKS